MTSSRFFNGDPENRFTHSRKHCKEISRFRHQSKKGNPRIENQTGGKKRSMQLLLQRNLGKDKIGSPIIPRTKEEQSYATHANGSEV